MNPQSLCASCGALLPADARFCPRCGREAAATIPPAVPDEQPALAPPPPIERSGRPIPEGPRSRTWLLVPLVIAVLAGLTLAILSRMPFGGRRETQSRVSAPETQLPPRDDGRIVEIDPDDPRVQQTPTQTVAPPPVTAAPREQVAPPPPVEAGGDAVVTESDAATSLLDYLQSHDVYGIDSTCLGVRNLAYENAGYTFEAMDQCEGARSLGKWRVDAQDGDIYRQRPDGRYLAP